MPVEHEKGRKFHSQPEARSDRGEPATANLFIFLCCAAEAALFAA